MFVRDVGGEASRVYLAGMTTPEGFEQRVQQELAEAQPDVLDGFND
jgi:hypothetical protein